MVDRGRTRSGAPEPEAPVSRYSTTDTVFRRHGHIEFNAIRVTITIEDRL
jgi:hypothetical protein